MGGSQKKLQTGEVLFHSGDQSDGMYLIRKGQVLVYLEKTGTEIPLAVATAGGMVGEMALIDKKPRSASAKAVDEVDLMHISDAEFNRILQQIPKWFVSLMATLSSKLRDTNEHLQKTEAKFRGKTSSLDQPIKNLRFILLLWHKHGVKEPKQWLAFRDKFEKELEAILCLESGSAQIMIDILIGGGLLHASNDLESEEVLVMSHLVEYERFIDFVCHLRKKSNLIAGLIFELTDIVEFLSKMAKATAYDSFSINLKILAEEAATKGFRTEKWHEAATLMVDFDEALQVTKMGHDIAFRVNKKRITTLLQFTKVLRNLLRN